MRRQSRLSVWIVFLMASMAVLPVIMTILHSFMGVDELRYSYPSLLNMGKAEPLFEFHLIPYKFTFSGYYQLIFEKIGFVKVYLNTVGIVLAIIVGQTLLSILTSYSLVHQKIRFRKQLLAILIFIALMPFQITAVPNYLALKKIGLLDTWSALFIIGVFSSFGTLLLIPFMRRVSKSSIEAAMLDGASEIQLVTKIVVPQVKTGIGLLLIFLFVDYWNMVEQPMVFIKDRAKHPMSVFLNYIAQTDLASFFPGATLYIIPSLLVFTGMIYILANGVGNMSELE